MKKLFLIALLLLSFSLLTSCIYTSYDSTIPEDFGEWDGNYIYYENKISKTTGDDEICLFNSFEHENILYTDIYIMDHIFMDNILYASVKTLDNNYSIIKYNIKTGNLDVLYFDDKLNFSTLIDYSSNHLIFFGNDIIKLDLISNEAYAINDVRNYILYDGYILYETTNYNVYLFNQTSNQSTLVCEALDTNTSYNTNYKLLNICNRSVILITRCATPYKLVYNNGLYIFGLEIYDIETKKLYILKEFNDILKINMISNEYFTIGIFKEIEHYDDGYRTYSFLQNQELYKIEYENGFKLNLLYEFDEQYDCSEAYIDNNNIRFKLKYLVTCNDRGELKCKFKKVKFSLKNNKLKSAIIFNDKLIKKDNVKTSKSIKNTLKYECGKYTYYFKKEYYSQWGTYFTSYYLYKTNIPKDKVMQYYSDNESYSAEIYTVSSFLVSCANETDPNKILITDFILNK